MQDGGPHDCLTTQLNQCEIVPHNFFFLTFDYSASIGASMGKFVGATWYVFGVESIRAPFKLNAIFPDDIARRFYIVKLFNTSWHNVLRIACLIPRPLFGKWFQ